MARKPREYVRLPGRGYRRQSLFSVVRIASRLYLGPDHLLLVDSTGGCEEDYRRLYYRDIQTFQVRQTPRGKYWNIALGAFTLLLVGVAFLAVSPVWRAFWLAGAALFGMILFANALRGPTCVSHIRTAVQQEELPSLRRLRTARGVLVRLRSKIEEAQGIVDAQMLTAGAAGPVATVVAARRTWEASTRERSYGGVWHATLFTLLLVDAAHTGLHFAMQDVWLSLLGSLLWCGIGLSAVFALLRSRGGSLPLALRVVTWCTVGYGLVCLGISYVQQIVVSGEMQAEGGFASQFQLLQRTAEISPYESPWLMAALLFALAGSTMLGGLGSVLTVRYRRALRVPPPLAAASATGDESAAGPAGPPAG